MNTEHIDVVAARDRLGVLLAKQGGPLTIALSGGIDSITLMAVAHRVRNASANQPTLAVHAVSPAVPPQATRRCIRLASRFGWTLEQLDAGEFANADYRSNPGNRCYFCKSSLFAAVLSGLAERVGTLATGTNSDDLADYRPGLQAAAENDVWQPFVQAGISKAMIRRIASAEGLGDLARLPAQPCLSSRIETGIGIEAADLQFVNYIERLLARVLGAGDIRCRITSGGVVIQLPADSPVFSDSSELKRIAGMIQTVCMRDDREFRQIEPYQMGSAFLRTTGANDTTRIVPITRVTS